MRGILSCTLLSLVVALSAALLISADEPTPRKPVVASATVEPQAAHAGDRLSLLVRVKIGEGWHIYASDSAGPEIVTTLKLGELPKGVESAGDWIWPKSVHNQEGSSIYEGTITVRHSLRLSANAPPGAFAIPCELGYQACNARSCRPPAKIKVTARGQAK